MTSAQAAHPDCDSPGARPPLWPQVWLSTGLSSECFFSLPPGFRRYCGVRIPPSL